MRTLAILAVAVLLLGCRRMGGPWPEAEIPAIEYPEAGVEGVMKWVSRNVHEVSDAELYGVREHWATPEETYAAMAGDCEDFAILALFLVNRDLGISGELVLGLSDSLFGDPHAWPRVDGIDYNPQVRTYPSLAWDHEGYWVMDALPWAEVCERIGI